MLEIFPIPILVKKLKLDTKKIIKHCLSIKKKTDSVKISNKGGWQSPPFIEDLFGLKNEILKHGEEYRKAIAYKSELKLANMWININGNKDYNIEHSHPHCVVSGAYYLTSNNSDLIFLHPSSQVMEYDWNHDALQNYNKYNSSVCVVAPPQDTLLLFPSWLKHRVEPNINKEKRISISFNLR